MDNLNNGKPVCLPNQHAPYRWVHSRELHNDTDVYTALCQHCGKELTYTGKTPPAGYDEAQQRIIYPAPENALKDKLQFLIRTASAIVRQRPGLPVVYIAGKVTGLPAHEVRNKFNNRKRLLKSMGYIVLNPIEFIEPNENWQTAMRMATTLLMMSEYICMLPDWQDSEGAKMEFALAAKFGINPITLD